MILLNDKASQVFSVLENHDKATSIENLFSTEDFLLSDGQICVPIGIDFNGKSIICDITKLPHLLIGGTTGSGKTAFIQSLLAGMITIYSYELLKFIIFDSKTIDYSVFGDLPNMMHPIITDAKKALRAIAWLRHESEKRMKQLIDSKCKDIEIYNDRHGPMPYIIAIFDDFADMAMRCGIDNVEKELVSVLSAGRIVGIHALIATSTPSTKMISTPIKSSIPSRMSFFVPSKDISRQIIDENGAEKLSQQGEFIIKNSQYQGKGVCLHADGDEINKIAAEIKTIYKLSFKGIEEALIRVFEKAKIRTKNENDNTDNDIDALFNESVDVVIEAGQVSISLLQRRFRIGYKRAAVLIDQMEQKGVIGGFAGTRSRQILVTPQQWAAMKTSKSYENKQSLIYSNLVDERALDSQQLLQSVDKKRIGWEFILLSDAFDAGIKNSADLKKKYSNSISIDNANTPLDVGNSFDWLTKKTNGLLEIIAPFEHIVNVDYIEAMGPYGMPGNADKIINVAERLIAIYRDLFKWASDFDTVSVRKDMQKLFMELKKMCLSPVADMEKFNDDMKEQVRRLKSERIDSINVKIVLNEPDISRFQAEFNKMKKTYNIL